MSENKKSEFKIQDSKISGDPKVDEQLISADKTRRTALLGAIGVAGAAGLPSEWKKPVIDGLLLPAHAQMSPTTTTSMVTSNTSTSSTTGTAVQTSTATTDVTQSRTVIITSGTAACSAITDRTTEAGTFYNTFPQGNGGSYYGGFISYTVSTQVVCVDDFSNTTQFSSSSYSGKYYSTFSYGSDISTLPSGTGSEQTITYSPPLTDVSYTISSSYTVSETTTVSGTVTISG